MLDIGVAKRPIFTGNLNKVDEDIFSLEISGAHQFAIEFAKELGFQFSGTSLVERDLDEHNFFEPIRWASARGVKDCPLRIALAKDVVL